MSVDEKPILHGRDHMPHGPDPIPGLPNSGDDVEDIIKGLPGLAAFWKLNETSGTVAADSSGNGHDLGANPTAPTWAQEIAPPGETSALFVDNNDGLSIAAAEMAAFTNNFTAGIWASFPSAANNNELIGQGVGGHSGNGWTLAIYSGVLNVLVNTDNIVGNATLSVDTWYFLACVRDSGTFKLYVNGLLQADTMTTSFTGSDLSWIGNDNFGSHTTFAHNVLMAYGFMVDDPLTSDELLEIYEAGFTGGFIGAGKVWTADGAGSASWQYPTIGVEY